MVVVVVVDDVDGDNVETNFACTTLLDGLFLSLDANCFCSFATAVIAVVVVDVGDDRGSTLSVTLNEDVDFCCCFC